MPAIATSLSAVHNFRHLLDYKAKGFFFLKHSLTEHTGATHLKAIHDKAAALYEAFLVGHVSRFTPNFHFTAVDETHIRMDILRPEGEPLVIASVLLVTVYESSEYCYHLELERTACVPECCARGLTFEQLRARLRAAMDFLPAAKAQFIGQQLVVADQLARHDTVDYSYDFTTDADLAELVTYRAGERYARLTVELQ